MKISTMIAISAAFCTAAPAFSEAAPAKNNEAIKDTHTVNDGKASSGANSFTHDQAREHIAKSGFSHVSKLTKDSSGVWRGTARKGGRTVHVSLDFKGNVSTKR
jgi:putative membrane protein